MPRAIALLDYGAGNLTSVRKGFAAAGADVFTPAVPAEIEPASGIVIPGVGHFGATAALDDSWRTALRDVVRRGIPVLGICLGLQWFFEASEEAPGLAGFGAISGRCSRLAEGQKIPHVGWNILRIRRRSKLLAGVADGSYAYFTHSYAAPVTDECIAVTDYGGAFASVVERDNIFGVQFHPEKSGSAGIEILANFVSIVAGRRC